MNRYCCDQKCQQDRQCPAFAPGVIDGPYRRSTRRKAKALVIAVAKGGRGALRLLWAYLVGPRP